MNFNDEEKVTEEDKEFIIAVYQRFHKSKSEVVQTLLNTMCMLEPKMRDVHIAETVNWIGELKIESEGNDEYRTGQ
jgi:hypothetical protein